MDDFASPLDLDGDDAIEVCLLFDGDGNNKGGSNQSPGRSGCCVIMLAGAGFLSSTAWSIVELLSQ